MIRKIKQILFSSTSFDSAVILTGNAVAILFIFLMTMILTRFFLTPGEFGLYVSALTFIQLLVDGFELGINPAILNFIPGSSSEEQKSIIKSSFLLKLIIGLILFLVVLIFARPISLNIFNNNYILPLVRISSIGIIFVMIIFWGQVIFQSRKQFVDSALIGALVHILRLAILPCIVILELFNLNNLFISVQLVLILVLFYIFNKLGLISILKSKIKLNFIKLFKFGLPIGLGFGVAALFTKLDQIFVLNIAGEKQAGIYALAFRLSSIVLILGVSLSNVIIPRFSVLKGEAFFKYFNKTLLATVGLSILILVAIPFSFFIIPFLFGKNFYESILPFQILTVGMVFFILSLPFNNSITYFFKKNFFSLILSVLSLVILLIVLPILIRSNQSIGAAYAVTIVYGLQLCLSVSYHLILSKNVKDA